MSLEILKKHKVDKELKIFEMDLLELLPDLKFSLEIPEVTTKIDYSRDTLEKGHIILPVLEINTLLPIQYTHEKNERVINTFPSYSNYVGYKVEYKRGDIIKIMVIEGVKVLKNSDEKFFDVLEITETPLHFEYNFVQKRWKKLDDIEIFEQKRNEIEDAIRSKEVMSIIEDYFIVRETILDDLMKMRAKTPLEAPGYVLKKLQIVKVYHELQNVLGEISDTHYELISKQIEDATVDTNKIQTGIDENTLSDYKLKEGIGDLRIITLQPLINVEGYWVSDDEIYPNISEFHNLKQKSKSSRTPSKQRLLKSSLFKYRETFNLKKKTYYYVSKTNDDSFKKFMEKVESEQE